MKKRILFLGCGGSTGINFVRALRLSGGNFYIVGLDINKYQLELSPVDKKYWINRINGEEKQYLKKILTIIKKERIDFIHAQPDTEVEILSKYRNKIPIKLLFPSKKAVTICQNKFVSYNVFIKHNVPVPKTIHITDQRELRKMFKALGRLVWLRAMSKYGGGQASLPVTKYEHALMWIDFWATKGFKITDFIASEYLPGREVSWLSLWKDGRLICSQGKERIEWAKPNNSPSGVSGTSGVQRTIHSESVNKVATEAVLAVDAKPNGIYTVDTKENSAGTPCVTEINIGRFFTTTLFFATAGVNIPLLYVLLGLNLPVPAVAQYNCVPENIYWIRALDANPVMIRGESWTSHQL